VAVLLALLALNVIQVVLNIFNKKCIIEIEWYIFNKNAFNKI